MADVDDDALLDGVMRDYVPRIGDDGISLGERGKDVRIDGNSVTSDEKQDCHADHNGKDQKPWKSVSTWGHLLGTHKIMLRMFFVKHSSPTLTVQRITMVS